MATTHSGRNLFFFVSFYISIQPCCGALLLPPSVVKTSVVYPLLPLDVTHNFLSFFFFFLLNIQKSCFTLRWQPGLWANCNPLLNVVCIQGMYDGSHLPLPLLISLHTRNTVCARARLCLYTVQITVGGSVLWVGLQNLRYTHDICLCSLPFSVLLHRWRTRPWSPLSYCVWSN